MADLQAEIELTVELRKFFNIDLFAQGYYQIRAGVKFAPKIQSAVKIEVKSELPPVFDDYQEQIYPACVFNDWGVSKTFMIMYKNEEIELDDQFNFKLSIIVDSENITECFNRMDMQLCIELYSSEKDYSQEKLSTMALLCSRCYKLNFNPRLGLHTHIPIIFDYFHLAAITTTIHGSLLCLIPPFVFDRPNVHQTSLFSFLFGQDLTETVSPDLLERAYRLHNNICEILLSTYESLQDFYEKMIEHLPANETKPTHNHQKCRQRLRNLCDKLKSIDDIQTIDNLAHAHIAQCSAENIMLWCQFIDFFGLHDTPMQILAKEYHLKRVKRLSEGFFIRETSRINLLTNENDTFNELHDLVRNSPYYSRLPSLPVECTELDGTPDTLPILIEEIYSPVDHRSISQLTYRPNTAKIVDSSLTTRAKSADQTKPKTVNLNTNSSPIVRPSLKSFLSFRNHSRPNINPVVALSNEPSVKLTSIRKVDQENPPLHKNSSLSLFPYQSNSNTNLSNSASSTRAASRHSLPNVPFHRSNSATTASDTLLESKVNPELLCTSFDNRDEEVFLATKPDEVEAASTFNDSSLKSKVLRASYHGKTNTMERRMNNTLTQVRSLSTSSTMHHNNSRQSPKFQEKKADGALDSVLNLTLQLEQAATADIQRRHTISADNSVDNDKQVKTTSEQQAIIPVVDCDEEKSKDLKEKHQNSKESDRIQNNASINSHTIEYVVNKEKLKVLLSTKFASNLMFFSDFSTPISPIPYFPPESILIDDNGTHLIVCVHGLDGNSADLRLIKTYLELCLPSCHLDFLMSSSNHSSTFDDIDIMVKQLIEEIDTHIERHDLQPRRISFVGHSLGNLIVRATVSHENFQRYRPLLYTYLSLSGPHLGTLFNTSGLVNAGMWIMQKWKNSCSLSQMSFKDATDPKQTYLYKLSKKPCLEFFKNILLIASPQDRYVPFHSARIEVCKAALKDTVYGSIYVEMISNLLEPILRNPSITFVRYNAFHNIPSGTNNIIGRAAHIAILDSE
ncbi:unnamed protein product, partial [Adineta ricciae]